MVFKDFYVFVLWTKVATALEGLKLYSLIIHVCTGLEISWSWEPMASLNSPAAPSNFCREPKDVPVSIHNTFNPCAAVG